MSLRIIKAGMLDTIQDGGRYGFQHLGINPSGAMDRFAAQVANALLGKDLSAPVLEMHFPAPQLCFQKTTIICLTGADFTPSLNGSPIPLNHPIVVRKGTVLQFGKMAGGARCYLSLLQPLSIKPWLRSYSTNIKANAGGWKGRALMTGDEIPYKEKSFIGSLLPQEKDYVVLPWTVSEWLKNTNEIECLIGSEWNWLTEEAQGLFQNNMFQVSPYADRMGYRLTGKELSRKQEQQLVSSPVNFGTVQLLPDGQLIVLMADHQTTGGYPRIAHVISADLPLLAQKRTNDLIAFRFTDLNAAAAKFAGCQKYLKQLGNACKFKMENLLHVTM